MPRAGFGAWRKSHVREWIKALPLGLGVPVMIGASSVKPEDAASNLAAWAQWVGIHDVPTWLNTPGIDGKVIPGTILISAIYTFGVWGVPLIRRSNYKARIFVPSNVTPERLLSFFEENTAINATELTKRYIGQWMPVTGDLRNVTAYGQVSFEKKATPLTWSDYADILCHFREDKIGNLKILKRGDKITVIGQIGRIGKLDLELYNCELVDP
jgi:hypothetical protein